jgi:hypothetical protein
MTFAIAPEPRGMAKHLDHDDSVALLKHYEVEIAEGHAPNGESIVIHGGPTPAAEAAITATIGTHSAHRLCPVTDFLAEGLVGELADPHLKAGKHLGRAIARLIVKLSRMHVDAALVSFSLTVLVEGDHYEVMPKTIKIEAPDTIKIPHRLGPHDHDRKDLHQRVR